MALSGTLVAPSKRHMEIPTHFWFCLWQVALRGSVFGKLLTCVTPSLCTPAKAPYSFFVLGAVILPLSALEPSLAVILPLSALEFSLALTVRGLSNPTPVLLQSD